ncbi:hypothetical protein BD770DRAFT_18019 [Pilaira anomala]|nr:hypothetical protein BD770DRAFT_18019 [Pilaira anomala]
MTSVQRPSPNGNINITIEAAISAERTSDPVDMRELVREYYQQLYTLDPVEDNEIDQYLQTIQFNKTVTTQENDRLMGKIVIEDLIDQVKRSPKQSSPGDDGLGYQYLHILFNIPILETLILEIYNNALTTEVIPQSWKDIRVRLLPKKKGIFLI